MFDDEIAYILYIHNHNLCAEAKAKISYTV